MAGQVGESDWTLRVLTANVNLTDEEAREKQAPAARANIAMMARHAIIFLQEFPAKGGENPYEELETVHGYKRIRGAFLYDPHYVDLLGSRVHYLTKNGKEDGPQWDSRWTRNAVRARFWIKPWGSELVCFDTHLDNEGVRARPAQMERLLWLANSTLSRNILIGGDFNADDDVDSHLLMPGEMEFTDIVANLNRRTFFGREYAKRRAPDRFFLKSPRIRAEKVELFPAIHVDGVYPSDHRWITAELVRA